MDATHAQHYAARLTRPDGADGTVWLLAKHHNSTRGAEEAAALVLAVKPSKARTRRRASLRLPRVIAAAPACSTDCTHRRVSA